MPIVASVLASRPAVDRNFATYGPFAAVKAGANRQAMHAVFREHALQAWAEIGAGRSNSLIEALCADPRVTQYVDAATVRPLLAAQGHLGHAPQRARLMAARLQAVQSNALGS